MGQVTVTINGRDYDIACDDGQESHLTKLSEFVDNRLSELIAAVGQVGDSRLLVMASLLLADELSEVCAELDKTQIDRQKDYDRAPKIGLSVVEIDQLASRIEKIAENLQQS